MSMTKQQLISKEVKDCYHLDLPPCQHKEMKGRMVCDSNPHCLHNVKIESLESIIKFLENLYLSFPVSTRITGYPSGLDNPGKVCYANCVLQCLENIPPFTRLFRSLPIPEQQQISFHLQKLLNEMHLSSRISVNPVEFLTTCKVNMYAQSNAFRFFSDLLSSLQRECTSNPILLPVLKLFDGVQLHTQCCVNCHRVFFLSHQFSHFDFVFEKDCRLEDYLQEVFSRKGGDKNTTFFCQSCQCSQPYEELKSISELPTILPIHINRSNPSINITLPISFDFNDFSTIERTVAVSEFILTGVIYYHENHYTCEVLHQGQWYSINDSTVRQVPCHYVNTKDSEWVPKVLLPKTYSVYPISYHDANYPFELPEDSVIINSNSKGITKSGDGSCQVSIPSCDSSKSPSVSDIVTGIASMYASNSYKSLEAHENESKSTKQHLNDVVAPVVTSVPLEGAPSEEKNQKPSPSVKEDKTTPSLPDNDMRIHTRSWGKNKRGGKEVLSMFQQLSESSDMEPAKLSQFVSAYNSVIAKELELVKARPPRKRRRTSATQSNGSSPDSFELEKFYEDNERNIKKVESVLQLLCDLRKEACKVLPSHLEQGGSAEASSQTNIELSSCSVMCFYVRKDQLESSEYSDSIPIPSNTESIQKNGESVTRLESLLLSLISQLKDRYKRVKIWSKELSSSSSFAKNVFVEVTDLEKWIGGTDLIESFMKTIKENDLRNDRIKKELNDLENRIVPKRFMKNECQHGFCDPLFFRKNYKSIPQSLVQSAQEQSSIVFHTIKEEEIRCTQCSAVYIMDLKCIKFSFRPLFNLYNALIQFIRYSKAKTPLDGKFFISKNFLLSLKHLVVNENSFLEQFFWAEKEMCRKCNYSLLNPTRQLLCSHGLLFKDYPNGERFAITEDLWNRLLEWYPSCVSAQTDLSVCQSCKYSPDSLVISSTLPKDLSTTNSSSISQTLHSIEKDDSHSICPSPGESGVSATQPLMLPPSTAPVCVKTEASNPSYADQQQNKTNYLDLHLSSEAVNGDGFLSSVSYIDPSFSENDIPSFATASPSTVCFSSPQEFTNDVPTGSSMYLAIENEQFQSSRFFIQDLHPVQRKQLLLQNHLLTRLIHRQTCISKTYFSRRPQISDGCYFILSANWLRRWRCWLLRNTSTDVNGVQCEAEYHSLQEIRFPRLCPHARITIPGYMDHFIRGFSSLPCSDLNQIPENEVEIIADYEFALLVKHHTFSLPLAGFFYGSTGSLQGLCYFPGQCRFCQEEEELRYSNYIRSLSLQRIVITSYGRLLTLHEERKIRLTPKEHHYFWLQYFEPDIPVVTLKYAIAKKTKRRMNDFHLRTRDTVIDESKTLQDNGINGESVIYVELN